MTNWLFAKTPLVFFVRTLWRDEAFSALLVQQSAPEIIRLAAKDFSPPLYYLLLHFWSWIFGTGEVALRSFSLVSFMAMGYVCFLFFNEVLKMRTRAAIAYTLLVLANPLLLYYAFEARMYAMMGFLAVLSYYAFATRKKKLHFLVTLAGVFTHYFLIFVPVSQALYLLLFERRSKEAKHTLKNFMIIGLLFIIWIGYFLANNQGVQDKFWITKKPSLTLLPAFLFVGFDMHLEFWKEFLKPLSVFITFVLGFGFLQTQRVSKEEMKKAALLALWTGVPALTVFFISSYRPLFLDRYLIFATAGFTILLSYLMHKMPAPARIVLLSVLLLFMYGLNTTQIAKKQHADSRKVFTEIKHIADENDVVYVTTELYFHEAQYYFDTNRVFIYGKSYEEIPTYVGKALIPETRIASSLPAFPTKAFIVDGNLSYTVQSQF